jgi:hypothetical protein
MGAAMTPGEILQQRWGEPWLVAAGAETFWSQLAQFQQQFQDEKPRDILLAEPDPIRFLAAFCAAIQQPGRVWLANPQWGTQEWSQVAAQCQPDLIIGTVPTAIQRPRQQVKNNRQQFQDTSPTPLSSPTSLSPPPSHPATQPPDDPTTLHIPTGGSSGDIRFAVHTWDTLTASVQGFCQHFDCATGERLLRAAAVSRQRFNAGPAVRALWGKTHPPTVSRIVAGRRDRPPRAPGLSLLGADAVAAVVGQRSRFPALAPLIHRNFARRCAPVAQPAAHSAGICNCPSPPPTA